MEEEDFLFEWTNKCGKKYRVKRTGEAERKKKNTYVEYYIYEEKEDEFHNKYWDKPFAFERSIHDKELNNIAYILLDEFVKTKEELKKILESKADEAPDITGYVLPVVCACDCNVVHMKDFISGSYFCKFDTSKNRYGIHSIVEDWNLVTCCKCLIKRAKKIQEMQ